MEAFKATKMNANPVWQYYKSEVRWINDDTMFLFFCELLIQVQIAQITAFEKILFKKSLIHSTSVALMKDFFCDQFVFIHHSEIGFQCTANENRCALRQHTIVQHKVNSIGEVSDHTLQVFVTGCDELWAMQDAQKRPPLFVFFQASMKQRYSMTSWGTDATAWAVRDFWP